MTTLQTVCQSLGDAVRTYEAPNGGIAVNTQVLFPSNGIVTVYVDGGAENCRVSDRGATARVVEGHAVVVPNVQRWLGSFAKPFGLLVTRNEIHSPMAPISALPSLIMLVANAASQAARYAIENYGSSSERDLEAEIEERLVLTFGRPHVSRNVEMTGESNRVYHFDFQVGGTSGEKIIVDHVNPYPSSINAKAVAHIDLSRRRDHRIRQAMVYDPSLDWNASDIIFLQSAAPTVPLERMNDAIQRKTIN